RFKGVVRGATVASFPVNPHTLRVFMADATVYVSADTLRDRLAAVRALRALNRPVGEHDRFRPRNLLALLGRCRAAKPAKPRPPLTANERYEARMKRSFLIESLGLAGIVVPPTAANPGALAHEFLVDSANIPPLARNEADRIDAIDPPDAVADVQHT